MDAHRKSPSALLNVDHSPMQCARVAPDDEYNKNVHSGAVHDSPKQQLLSGSVNSRLDPPVSGV